MYPDFRELLSAFNAHDVRYLVVGAYAVSLHAQPRATEDIDILVKTGTTNAASLFAALADFGAPLAGVSPSDFAEPGSFFRIGREPIAVDILTEIPGIDFDTAWEHRLEHVVDRASGLTANFISASDLVTSKLASGRPQDIADVDAIRHALRNDNKP
jgi:hypothetical protein